MINDDKMFAGSIPANYDRLLGPMLFQPYARDLARRAAELAPTRVLETAAGTGIATEALFRALPVASIIATDLNQAMVDIGSSKLIGPGVQWQVCDATHLPFGDEEFDAVVCQFGVMFFPDKSAAYKEVHRVLRPGGTFLFNVWDSLTENPLPAVVSQSVADNFPEDPPNFVGRTPHGYFDIEAIRSALANAGFSGITAEKLQLRSTAASARDVAMGFCHGTPLRLEIEKRDATGLSAVTEGAAAAVSAKFGPGPIDQPMQAIVISATA